MYFSCDVRFIHSWTHKDMLWVAKRSWCNKNKTVYWEKPLLVNFLSAITVNWLHCCHRLVDCESALLCLVSAFPGNHVRWPWMFFLSFIFCFVFKVSGFSTIFFSYSTRFIDRSRQFLKWNLLFNTFRMQSPTWRPCLFAIDSSSTLLTKG